MQPTKPSLENIRQQIDAIIAEAEGKVAQAKNTEREIRLRINQLNRQVDLAQDALKQAQSEQADVDAANEAKTAEIGRVIAEKQAELDKLNAELEPARRRHENITARITEAEGVIQSLNIRKKSLEDDITNLTTECETVADELAKARESKDKTLENLSDAIKQKSDELQAFSVKMETIRVEHQRRVDELTAAESRLTESIADLRKQEIDLTNKNAELQHNNDTLEAKTQEAMASLKRRENDLDLRERAVKNKERSVATQLRRNLT